MRTGWEHSSLLHRFKGTARLFDEFKGPHQGTELLTGVPARSAGGSARREVVMSAADINALIKAAAAHVLGVPVGDDEPLSGAGLDSLGETSSAVFCLF